MEALSDFFTYWYDWLYSNLIQIAFSITAFIVVYATYKILTKQMTRLKEQQKLDENVAFILNRIFQWAAVLILIAFIFGQFGVEIGVIFGLFALAGGTIIGFAAINTIGNAIAGIIVMTSKPFRIGDRIHFNGQFVDVEAIDLIYTRMKTLDNVLVSVPNQELLRSEIDNYGKKTIIRRSCSITSSYQYDTENIESILLEAVEMVVGVLKNPAPYVWLTDFQDFAVEYTLYFFIDEVKSVQKIDAELKLAVLKTCKHYKIDISTPRLIHSINNDNANDF